MFLPPYQEIAAISHITEILGDAASAVETDLNNEMLECKVAKLKLQIGLKAYERQLFV